MVRISVGGRLAADERLVEVRDGAVHNGRVLLAATRGCRANQARLVVHGLGLTTTQERRSGKRAHPLLLGTLLAMGTLQAPAQLRVLVHLAARSRLTKPTHGNHTGLVGHGGGRIQRVGAPCRERCRLAGTNALILKGLGVLLVGVGLDASGSKKPIVGVGCVIHPYPLVGKTDNSLCRS